MPDLQQNTVDTSFTSPNPRKKDLLGQRFTRLLVIEECGKNSSRNIKWKCRCDCGSEIITLGIYLTSGDTKSCGCFSKDRLSAMQTKHGLWKHPLFSIWQGIISRCYNTNIPAYKNYGGTGVVVCDEWRNDFKSFYDWCIAKGWEKELEIDKDVKAKELGLAPLLYSPERCSLVSRKKNSRNRRNNRIISVKGKSGTISEFTEIYNLPHYTISQRLRLGWTSEEAVFGKMKI